MKKDCTCPRSQHQHGTTAGYRTCGCRCADCCAASTRATKSWRHRALHDAVQDPGAWYANLHGTMLRLQALARLGWTARDIAAITGKNSNLISKWRVGERARIWPEHAAAIAEAYNALWDQVPPQNHARSQVRSMARRKGWLPPMALDDDRLDDPTYFPMARAETKDAKPVDVIAVEEAIRGRPVSLSPRERAEAVARMTARGYSTSQIADRLGLTMRAVTRVRATKRVA